MIPTTEQFWDEYNGDDVTTSFPITTAVKDFDPTLVTVARKISDGTKKAVDKDDYSVDKDNKSVEMKSAPETGEVIYIIPTIPMSQLVQFLFDQSFEPEVFEQALDRLTLIVQELSRRLDNTISLAIPESDVSMELETADLRASRAVCCDSTGKKFVMQSLIDLGTPVDSWVATYLLVCSSDEEIREILDIYSVEEINTFLGTIYTKDEVDDLEDSIISLIEKSFIYKKDVGDYFFNAFYKEPSTFNIESPEDFFGGICLSTIDGYKDYSGSNFPDLIPLLRSWVLTYLKGRTGETSELDVTAWEIASNIATLTLSDNDAENALLAIMLEDKLVHGSYSNWRTLTVAADIGDIPAGTYEITGIDTTSRTVSFALAASDNSGSDTGIIVFYPYRVAGSETTARLFEVSDRVLISEASDGTAVSGLRHRDATQRWTATLNSYGAGDVGTFSSATGAITLSDSVGNRHAGSNDGTRYRTASFDPANSTSPNPMKVDDDKSKPKALGGFFYIHGGRYLASA